MHPTYESHYNIEKFSLFFVLIKEWFSKLIIIENGRWKEDENKLVLNADESGILLYIS